MRVLIAVATSFEVAPLLQHLQKDFVRRSAMEYTKGDLEICISITGIGTMLTTYHLMDSITSFGPNLCLQMGVAGSYNHNLNLGDVVFVGDEFMGDLGVEDSDGFKDIFTIQLMEPSQKPFISKTLRNTFFDVPLIAELPVVSAITVNTVSGTEPTIKSRTSIYNCDLESMEGAAFHYVCLNKGLPFLQVRAISNYVEPRNKDNWKMREAIVNVNEWMIGYLSRLVINYL